MTILSGKAIVIEGDAGCIEIDPFNEKQLNPTSYDLTLGSTFRVYRMQPRVSWIRWMLARLVHWVASFFGIGDGLLVPPRSYLDAREDNPTDAYEFKQVVLRPGELYLMHTREIVNSNYFVGIVDGKSSIGRLGTWVHVTAGYIDPGFRGQITLEVTCIKPVRLYAGMRIAQIRFEPIAGEVDLYDGHYKGATAKGAVASHSWEQFE